MNKKAIAGDVFLNILATALPTFALQLLFLPLIAARITDEAYGVLVSVIAFLNISSVTAGNVLSNVRLINGQMYDEKNLVGDYNRIMLILLCLNTVAVGIAAVWLEGTEDTVSLMLTILLSLIWLFKEYLIVGFRIIINYRLILLNSFLMLAGYGLGYLVFLKIGRWQMVYLAGQLVSLIFLMLKINLWREPCLKTELYGKTMKSTADLLFAGLLSKVNTYADKLIIFPVIGAENVAVYHASSLMAKVVGLVITPISTVILTYLAKEKKKNNKTFIMSLLLSTALGLVGYFGCVLTAKPILSLLYPQYVDTAVQYISVTSATTVFNLLITVVKPFIMKFFDLKYQIYLNGGSALMYILLGGILCYYYGLMGFCIGALLTNAVKFIAVLIIYKKAQTTD